MTARFSRWDLPFETFSMTTGSDDDDDDDDSLIFNHLSFKYLKR